MYREIERKEKKKRIIILKQTLQATLGSITGAILSIPVRETIPPVYIIIFFGCIPSTIYAAQNANWLENADWIKKTFILLITNLFNMHIAVGVLISLALLLITAILHPFGISFTSSFDYLLGTE